VISDSKVFFIIAFSFDMISFSTSKTSKTRSAAANPFFTEYEALEMAFAGENIKG
jgi:hypothetical protein